MKSPKILFISNQNMFDSDPELVKALQDQGCDITYMLQLGATSRYKIDAERIKGTHAIIKAEECKDLENYRGYIDFDKFYIRYCGYQHSYTPDALASALELMRFIIRGKYDVVQYTQVFMGYDIINYRFRRKMVKMVHDPFTHSGESLRGVMRFYYKLGTKVTPRFVLLNQAQSQDFYKVYRVRPERVHISHLGVRHFMITYLKGEKSTAYPSHRILFFGRISPYKGLEYLCEAMKMVVKEVPDAELTIAGGGKLYFDFTPYEDWKYIKLDNRYVPDEEIAQLINNAAICVCPYTDATQSGIIANSFGLDTPVIATNVGGLPDMVEDGKTGLIVPPKDSRSLADAIIKLLNDNSLLSQMQSNIRQENKDGEKSWKHLAKGYLNFYQTIK